MSKKVYNVRYSRIVGVPCVGVFFLAVQRFLFRHGVITTIFISRRNSSQRRMLLAELCSKKGVKIMCVWQLGYQLHTYKHRYTLAVSEQADLRSMSISELYDLMWAIHFSKNIDKKSAAVLSPLLYH